MFSRPTRSRSWPTMASNLAARTNRLRNILRLRGCQHENNMVRGLFQRLQQRVKCGVGNLVSFVEDVNLETISRRAITRGLAKFTDFIDAAIRGGVDLNDVDRVTGADLGAGFADAAWLRHRPGRRTAIQRRG